MRLRRRDGKHLGGSGDQDGNSSGWVDVVVEEMDCAWKDAGDVRAAQLFS